jgi:hypothetical protein
VCEIRMPTAIASMCALCDVIACIDGRWVGCRQVVKERSGCAQAQEGEGGCGDVGGGGKVKVLNEYHFPKHIDKHIGKTRKILSVQ